MKFWIDSIAVIVIVAQLIACFASDPDKKEDAPTYEAPSWEYADWAEIECGEDGGDIDIGQM